MIRVLLADDHAVVRDGLRALLEAQGDMAVVAAVADGAAALERARALAPDVAVLDLAMPGLNGVEACRELAAAAPAVRCLFLSMHGSTEHVHRALRAGGRGYLLKESAGGRVAEAVRAVHAGRLFLDPDLSPELLRALRQRHIRPPTPLETLSSRERQVLQLVAEGLSSAAVAERLLLSPKTVDTYRSRLMAKLEIGDLPSLVKFAVRHGLTPPE